MGSIMSRHGRSVRSLLLGPNGNGRTGMRRAKREYCPDCKVYVAKSHRHDADGKLILPVKYVKPVKYVQPIKYVKPGGYAHGKGFAAFPGVIKPCDCESSTCKADCNGMGSVKTTHSTICSECAKFMPKEYLV